MARIQGEQDGLVFPLHMKSYFRLVCFVPVSIRRASFLPPGTVLYLIYPCSQDQRVKICALCVVSCDH